MVSWESGLELELKLHQGRDLIQHRKYYPSFIMPGIKGLEPAPHNSRFFLPWANPSPVTVLSVSPFLWILRPPFPSPGPSSFLCLSLPSHSPSSASPHRSHLSKLRSPWFPQRSPSPVSDPERPVTCPLCLQKRGKETFVFLWSIEVRGSVNSGSRCRNPLCRCREV
jgi:hypothetical protein